MYLFLVESTFVLFELPVAFDAGTTRAQDHLRSICTQVNLRTMPNPDLRVEIFRDNKPKPFDAATGNLICAETTLQLQGFIKSYLDWIKKVAK